MSLTIVELSSDNGANGNTSAAVAPGQTTPDPTPYVYVRWTGPDATAGNVVRIYAVDSAGRETQVGSKTLDEGVDLNPGEHPIAITTSLSPGSYQIIVRSAAAASDPFPVTIATAAINAPVPVAATDDVLPDGGSSSAGSGSMQTNDPSPTFKLSLANTGATAGDRVELGVNGQVVGSHVLTAQDVAAGYAYADGALSVQYWQTVTGRLVHADGSFGGWSSQGFILREDTIAPAAPQIQSVTDDAGPATGPVPVGGTTDDATPTFQFGYRGETLSVPPNTSPGHSPYPQSTLAAVQLIENGQVVASGYPNQPLTTPALALGAHTFTARFLDASGNASPDSAPFSFTVVGAAAPVTGSAPTITGVGGSALPAFTVSEANLAAASTGGVTLSAPDGIRSLTLGGQTVIDAAGFHPGAWTTPDGVFTVNAQSYDAASGRLDLSVKLNAGVYHNSGETVGEAFGLTLTDRDGDSTQAVLAVNVQDAGPSAAPDQATVQPGQTATGNLIANDNPGPDGAVISTVTQALPGGGAQYSSLLTDSAVIEGRYGDLTIHWDGSYAYKAFADAPAGASESFGYWLQQPDNDQVNGYLTVTIQGGASGGGGSTGGGTSGQVINSPGPGATLTGGSGDDTLNASQGGDHLTGGAGADVFAWAKEPWAPATVTDFQVGTDKLDLSALLRTAGYSGSDPVGDHYITVQGANGGTQILFDHDGPGPSPQWPNYIIMLQGVTGPVTWSQLSGVSAAPPTASLSGAVSAAEGDSGATPFTFTVTRSGPADAAATVNWQVHAAGANPASISDFVGATDHLPAGQVSFAAGETSKTVTVQVAGDTAAEPDETFTLDLLSASGVVIGPQHSATGTILNDDSATSGGGSGGGGSGQVLTSARYGDTLIGGAGDDTLNAGQGPDQLTGGGGGDSFAFANLPWNAGHVTDFQVGGDRIDLSALFRASGYTGSDPVADGYVRLEGSANGGPVATRVFYDTDGHASGNTIQFLITTLDGVPASSVTWGQLAGGAGGSTGGGGASGGTGGSSGGAGQVLTSSKYGDVLTGGAGDDTLNAGQGPDQLTGAGGADHFVFQNLPWNAGHVTDFTPGTDKLDLRPLFQQSGYAGTDPLADHHLEFRSDGAGNTQVYFDHDAVGSGDWPYLITTLDHVTPAQIGAGDWLFH